MKKLIEESIELIKRKVLHNQNNDMPFVGLCSELENLLALAKQVLEPKDELISEIIRVKKVVCDN